MKDVGKTWSLGGVYFICEEDSMNKPNLRYSEHAVLDSNETVIMLFGKEHDTRTVSGVLWSGIDALQDLVGSGWIIFNSDQGFEGLFHIQTLDIDTQKDIKRNVPVYRITADLRKQ